MRRRAQRRDGVHRVAEAPAGLTAASFGQGRQQRAVRAASPLQGDGRPILRLFEQHSTRCRVVAELWSFENIKEFVQPGGRPRDRAGGDRAEELKNGTLVRIPLSELAMPRRTLMIYRDQGYMSEAARELIGIVRAFNWHDPAAPLDQPARTATAERLSVQRRNSRGLRRV